jgi:hypothetical protein
MTKLILFLFLVSAPALLANSYSTKFPLTENPISEGGIWLNGQSVGINWSDVSTIPGLARGNQAHTGHFNDSTAILNNGPWGPDQTVSAVMVTSVPVDNAATECEIRLRSTMTPNQCTGYEIFWSAAPDGNYLGVARWNGSLDDFTLLSTVHGVPPINGGTLTAAIVGNVITAYINGVQKMQVTDGIYTSGNPGIGFYWISGNSGIDFQNRFGWSSFIATDGMGATPTPAPTPIPSPTPTPTPTPTPATYAVWESSLLSYMKSIGIKQTNLNAIQAWMLANPPTP